MIEMEVAALAAQRGAPADVRRLESLAELPTIRGAAGPIVLTWLRIAPFTAHWGMLPKRTACGHLPSVMDQLQRLFYLVVI